MPADIPPFRDRADAGRALAPLLHREVPAPDPVILALPPGGVPVACEVARAYDAPLDAFVVRRLVLPGHEEETVGALASGDILVLDHALLSVREVPDPALDRLIERERQELARREDRFRASRLPPDVAGRTAILVDDGMATGTTMATAVAALRRLRPWRIVVAVPVAAPAAVARLRGKADAVVCLATPAPFTAVARWYGAFPPVGDHEVHELLAQREHERALLAGRR